VQESYRETDIFLSFYNYPDTVSYAKRVGPECLTTLEENPIRNQILQVLRQGVTEKHPITEETTTRHVLSANEIRELLETEFKEQIGKSLYYHLNILLDLELLKEVGSIVIGRRENKFFGRTATFFLFNPDDQTSPVGWFDQSFVQFIKALNPQLDGGYIEQLVQTVKSDIKNAGSLTQELDEWLEEHREAVNQVNDVGQFMQNLSNFIDLILNFKFMPWEKLEELYELLHAPDMNS
jgi:hypothetical protein